MSKRGGIKMKKIAVITGAAKGIGRAISIKFANEGFKVILVDIDVFQGRAVADDLLEQGFDAQFYDCDLSKEQAMDELIEYIKLDHKYVNVLVNAAGITVRANAIELSLSEWNKVMTINATAPFYLSKLIIPIMKKIGCGAIVNIASGWGLVGGSKAVAYCASKGALVLMTKSMAIDHGPQNIRVNCICPGDTDTGMLTNEARQLNLPDNALLEAAIERPLQRVGEPTEIAEAVYFLASDKASFITGEALVVDGGGLAGSG